MPFRWVPDPGAESEGIVLAVDVSRHARSAGFASTILLSRGVWASFIGEGPAQERHLLDTLSAARVQMGRPTSASEDGTVLRFPLEVEKGSAPVVAVVDPGRESVTFMLWREFTRRPGDGSLRVRIVAEEEPRPGV